MTRQRLPTTRRGTTYKIQVGPCTVYLTANTDAEGRVMELFMKAEEGWSGWADALMVTASLALQHGCPLETLLAKWRGMRFPPAGVGASSIPDGVARRLAGKAEKETSQ
jgi:hypothetical protein